MENLKLYRSMPEVIKTICCECEKILTEGPPEPVSHGYCEACSSKLLWLDGLPQKELTEFIDKMRRRDAKS